LKFFIYTVYYSNFTTVENCIYLVLLLRLTLTFQWTILNFQTIITESFAQTTMKLLLLFEIFILVFSTQGKRILENIYVKLNTSYSCSLILNGTHEFGCKSYLNGNKGVLFWARSLEDLNYIQSDESQIGPYVLMIESSNLVSLGYTWFQRIKSNIAGLLIYVNESNVNDLNFSEDTHCPNSNFDIYTEDPDYSNCKKNEWNKYGNGIRFFYWGIPVFLVLNETEVQLLIDKCFMNYNYATYGNSVKWPLCAAELTDFKLAAGDAERCIRRNEMNNIFTAPVYYCMPIQNWNVYAFLPQRSSETLAKNHSVFMLMSRVDSFTMFDDMDYGSSAISSLLVILAVSEALGKDAHRIADLSAKNDRQLLLALFAGESFDYIGSSRMVWEMMHNNFPAIDSSIHSEALATLSNLGFLLEVGDLTYSNDSLYMHIDPRSYQKYGSVKEKIDMTVKALKEHSSSIQFISDKPLPPSSLHSFLKEDDSIPAIAITGYGSSFTNRFYNSFLDQPRFLNIPEYKKTALDVANSLVKLSLRWLNNDVDVLDPPVVNQTMFDIMTDCFLQWPNFNCTLFLQLSESLPPSWHDMALKALTTVPGRRTFTGLGPEYMILPSRVYSELLMFYFLGERVESGANLTYKSCFEMNNTNPLQNCLFYRELFLHDTSDANNYCICSPVKHSLARSPAFDIADYNYKSGKYSTWVMSLVNNEPTMRIYLVNSPAWQLTVFLTGIGLFFVSLFFIHVITKSSHLLFSDSLVAV
ncbi:Nicastrin, partial [Trichinella sp. T8]